MDSNSLSHTKWNYSKYFKYAIQEEECKNHKR